MLRVGRGLIPVALRSLSCARSLLASSAILFVLLWTLAIRSRIDLRWELSCVPAAGGIAGPVAAAGVAGAAGANAWTAGAAGAMGVNVGAVGAASAKAGVAGEVGCCHVAVPGVCQGADPKG